MDAILTKCLDPIFLEHVASRLELLAVMRKDKELARDAETLRIKATLERDALKGVKP